MEAETQPEVTFTVSCIDAAECTVHFEPDGAFHVLRADDEFRVDITRGTLPLHIEIAYHPGGISIVEASDAEVRVRNRDGVELPI